VSRRHPSLQASNQPGHYKQSYHMTQLSLMYSCCKDSPLASTNRPHTRPPITPQLLLMAWEITWPLFHCTHMVWMFTTADRTSLV